MANEIRMTSHGEVGALDTDDFVVTAVDENGAVQLTMLRIPLAGYQACNASTLTAAGSANLILPGVTNVVAGANVNDANDWLTLPAIDSVPIGHTIRIACNAGANFELRTPASSNTKINDVDSDGTQEYLCTDTDVIIVTKRTTTGWAAQSITKLGAVRTAVVPD